MRIPRDALHVTNAGEGELSERYAPLDQARTALFPRTIVSLQLFFHATSSSSLSPTLITTTTMSTKLQQEPSKSPLASALGNLLCLVVLATTSVATFGYLRALQPLYGTAARDYHLNKVVWAACIFGSLAPTIPAWPAVLVGGILLSAMPMSTYWVAVLTGRLGDPVWGPVVTHLSVIGPVIYLASALVKALQVSPVS